MKKIMSFVLVAAVLISSCTRNTETPQTNNSNNSTIVTGSFTITKFTDRNLNEDKTADFNGYTFMFSVDGKISALKNNIALPGSYKETPSHESEGAKLTINFSDASLNELNKNWQIDLISNNAIHLSDDDASANEVIEFSGQ